MSCGNKPIFSIQQTSIPGQITHFFRAGRPDILDDKNRKILKPFYDTNQQFTAKGLIAVGEPFPAYTHET